MPIRSRQKKPNDEPRQKPNHSHAVVDPMVDPGSPPHRRQARAKADTTRTHHRMVTLAQNSSGGRSASPPQSETATVMLTAVIASEAKQSSGQRRKCGLLRRYAPRNDGTTPAAPSPRSANTPPDASLPPPPAPAAPFCSGPSR